MTTSMSKSCVIVNPFDKYILHRYTGRQESIQERNMFFKTTFLWMCICIKVMEVYRCYKYQLNKFRSLNNIVCLYIRRECTSTYIMRRFINTYDQVVYKAVSALCLGMPFGRASWQTKLAKPTVFTTVHISTGIYSFKSHS